MRLLCRIIIVCFILLIFTKSGSMMSTTEVFQGRPDYNTTYLHDNQPYTNFWDLEIRKLSDGTCLLFSNRRIFTISGDSFTELRLLDNYSIDKLYLRQMAEMDNGIVYGLLSDMSLKALNGTQAAFYVVNGQTSFQVNPGRHVLGFILEQNQCTGMITRGMYDHQNVTCYNYYEKDWSRGKNTQYTLDIDENMYLKEGFMFRMADGRVRGIFQEEHINDGSQRCLLYERSGEKQTYMVLKRDYACNFTWPVENACQAKDGTIWFNDSADIVCWTDHQIFLAEGPWIKDQGVKLLGLYNESPLVLNTYGHNVSLYHFNSSGSWDTLSFEWPWSDQLLFVSKPSLLPGNRVACLVQLADNINYGLATYNLDTGEVNYRTLPIQPPWTPKYLLTAPDKTHFAIGDYSEQVAVIVNQKVHYEQPGDDCIRQLTMDNSGRPWVLTEGPEKLQIFMRNANGNWSFVAEYEYQLTYPELCTLIVDGTDTPWLTFENTEHPSVYKLTSTGWEIFETPGGIFDVLDPQIPVVMKGHELLEYLDGEWQLRSQFELDGWIEEFAIMNGKWPAIFYGKTVYHYYEYGLMYLDSNNLWQIVDRNHEYVFVPENGCAYAAAENYHYNPHDTRVFDFNSQQLKLFKPTIGSEDFPAARLTLTSESSVAVIHYDSPNLILRESWNDLSVHATIAVEDLWLSNNEKVHLNVSVRQPRSFSSGEVMIMYSFDDTTWFYPDWTVEPTSFLQSFKGFETNIDIDYATTLYPSLYTLGAVVMNPVTGELKSPFAWDWVWVDHRP